MVPIGICFVSEDDWLEYCQISTDIPVGSPYTTWLIKVEEICTGLAAKGQRVVKVDTKPADLLRWCQARGLTVNKESRSQYAATRAMEAEKG